jgi:hypothetical protein
MIHGDLQGAGTLRGLKDVDVKVVAFYEPNTGDIVFMHTVVTLQGGRTVSEGEAIEEAHRQASRIGLGMPHLKIKVSCDPKHALDSHRIELESGEFVRLSPPEFKRHSYSK